MMDEVRIYKALPSAEDRSAILACPDSLSRIAAIPPQTRTEGQRLKIRNAFLEEAAPVAARRAWTRCENSSAREPRSKLLSLTLMVMQELPEPRPAYVLKRGSYDAPGRASRTRCSRRVARLCRQTGRTTGLGSRAGLSAPKSAHVARDCQPLLADVVRYRAGEDGGRFRRAGRTAFSS